jgi:hypothetical protein
MTFLNPTALLALMAAALPLVIHLLNLRKYKKVEISSLAFIKELQKTKIKRIKIKQLILLAVRMLLIASLVLAFSKPAIRSLRGYSSGAKTTAVIIIDNSFSMSIVDAGGSYFNQAKQAAEQVINNLNTGDEVALIFTGDAGENEVKPVTDFYKLKKAIEDAPIKNSCAPLLNLIAKARPVLTESQNVNKEVYVISDFQKSTVSPAPDNGILKNETTNEYSRIYFIEVPERKTSNLSVTGLTADNQIFEPGKPVSFAAVVSNYSPSNIENSVISLFINGKRTAQQGINLAAGETRRLTFETSLNETGYLNVSVELEDDDILQDNKRFLCLYVPEKINIASFSDNADDLNFISLAINASSAGAVELTEKSFAQINSLNLSKYDLLLLCGSENISGYKPLQDYLANGGNILFFPGSKSTLSNYNKLCDALQTARGENILKYSNGSSVPVFDKIDFLHPILSGIFEKKEQAGISSPSFFTFIKLAPGTGRNIFTLTGGNPFLVENNSLRGKVLQFSCAPVLSTADFPAKAIFAPLIQKCVSYLAVKYSGSTDKLAGESIFLKTDNPNGTIRAELPDKESVIINQDNANLNAPLVFTNTGQTGNYKFFNGDKLIDFSSLNFNSIESVLERMNRGALESLIKKQMINSTFYGLDIKKEFRAEIETSRYGLELWKYFLFLAALLAITEMFLSKSSKKDIIETEKA